MKKTFYRMLGVFCMLFAVATVFTLTTPSAEAGSFETVDGAWCWNGDTNYPVVDMGSGFWSAADASSSFVEEESNGQRKIRFTKYFIERSTGELVDTSTGSVWTEIGTNRFFFGSGGGKPSCLVPSECIAGCILLRDAAYANSGI